MADGRDAPHPAVAPEVGRLVMAEWRGSALRGLALLAAALVVVVGYQAWTGRPRAIAEVPVSVASASVPAPATPSALRVAPGVDAPATDAPAGVSPVAVSQAGSTAPASPPAVEVQPPVVVHVVGLVARPGLVSLPAGSRVADAIEAAGGVTRPRAADSVNLARPLVDGEQVAVGRPALPGAGPPAASGGAAGTGAAGVPLLVDLNTASAEQLDSLPGIGPVIAGRIVAWRAANGAFRSVDELGEVSGIGDAILGQIRTLVRV